MSDARSVLSEMQISQAEHLPLVAAFLERMGLAAVVNAAVLSQMAIDLGSVAKLMVLGHALREEPPLVAWRGSLRQWTPSCGSAVARHRSRVGHGLETTYRFATAPTRMHNSPTASNGFVPFPASATPISRRFVAPVSP